MKNYYEILEVDKNASQEVIEKAYRALTKKYHPDLQQGFQQQEYAKKMKIINQAYDILSDSAKREEYNQKLEIEKTHNEKKQDETISREEQERIIRENYILKQQLNRMRANNQTVDQGTFGNMTKILNEQIKNTGKYEHYNNYTQYSNNKLDDLIHNIDIKYCLKIIGILIIFALIFFLIYQIPIIKSFFQNLYNDNLIFRAIVNIFKNTFSTRF